VKEQQSTKTTLRRSGDTHPPKLRSARSKERGSQIVEFAMVLPVFLVFTVAAFDLGGAFTSRDKLANAARDGARLAVRQSTLDLSSAAPPSVNAVANAVLNYLKQAKVIDSACTLSETHPGFWTWTFTGSCPDNLVITIERAYRGSPAVSANGAAVIMSRVTISFPARFYMIHKAIQLIAPGANLPGLFTLTTHSVMNNQV